MIRKPVEGPGPDRGMVFQDYTSFDHRTVLDNVAFGLECSGVARKEREDPELACGSEKWASTRFATEENTRTSFQAGCGSASRSPAP